MDSRENVLRSRQKAAGYNAKLSHMKHDSAKAVNDTNDSSARRIVQLETVLRQLQQTQDKSSLRNRSLLQDFDSAKEKIWTWKDNNRQLHQLKERFNENIKKMYPSDYGKHKNDSFESMLQKHGTTNKGNTEANKSHNSPAGNRYNLNQSNCNSHHANTDKFCNITSSLDGDQKSSTPLSLPRLSLDSNVKQSIPSGIGSLTVLPQVLAMSPDGQLVLLPMSYSLPILNSTLNDSNEFNQESLNNISHYTSNNIPTDVVRTLKSSAMKGEHRDSNKELLNEPGQILVSNQNSVVNNGTEDLRNQIPSRKLHSNEKDSCTAEFNHQQQQIEVMKNPPSTTQLQSQGVDNIPIRNTSHASQEGFNTNQQAININTENFSNENNKSYTYSNHLGDSVSFGETDDDELDCLNRSRESNSFNETNFLQVEDFNDVLPQSDKPSPTLKAKHFVESHSNDNNSKHPSQNKEIPRSHNSKTVVSSALSDIKDVPEVEKPSDNHETNSKVQHRQSFSNMGLPSNSLANNRNERDEKKYKENLTNSNESQDSNDSKTYIKKTKDRFVQENESDDDLFSDESLPLSESFGIADKLPQETNKKTRISNLNDVAPEKQLHDQEQQGSNFELISSLFHLLEKQIEDEYVKCHDLYTSGNESAFEGDFLRLGIDNILKLKGNDLLSAIISLIKNKVKDICQSKDAIQLNLTNVDDLDLIAIRNSAHPNILGLLDIVLDFLSFMHYQDPKSTSIIAKILMGCFVGSDTHCKVLIDAIVESLETDAVQENIVSPSHTLRATHMENTSNSVIPHTIERRQNPPAKQLSLDLGSISSDESSISSFDSEKMTGNNTERSAKEPLKQTTPLKTKQALPPSSQWKPMIDSQPVEFHDDSDDGIEELLGSGLGTSQPNNNDNAAVETAVASFRQSATPVNDIPTKDPPLIDRKKSQETITRSSSIKSPSPPPSHSNSIKSKVLRPGFWEDSDEDDNGPDIIPKTNINKENNKSTKDMENDDDFDFDFYS